MVSDRITQQIKTELSACKKSFTLVSAYCKLQALKQLDSSILEHCIKKTLIVRLRLADVLSGATELELYPFCAEHGWSLYFKLDLHAKLYLFDDNHFIIGSANATSNGLGICSDGNYEMAVTGIANQDDIKTVHDLINNSTEITESLYSKMKEYVQLKRKDIQLPDYGEWPRDILFPALPDFSSLSPNDFPPFEDPDEDLSATKVFLNLPPSASNSEIEYAFSKTKGYEWLYHTLTKEDDHKKRFRDTVLLLDNQMKGVDHKACKVCLHNLQEWIKSFQSLEIAAYPYRIDGYSHEFAIKSLQEEQ